MVVAAVGRATARTLQLPRARVRLALARLPADGVVAACARVDRVEGRPQLAWGGVGLALAAVDAAACSAAGGGEAQTRGWSTQRVSAFWAARRELRARANQRCRFGVAEKLVGVPGDLGSAAGRMCCVRSRHAKKKRRSLQRTHGRARQTNLAAIFSFAARTCRLSALCCRCLK